MDEETSIDNPIVEMGLVITKASFAKDEPNPDKKRRIMLTNSDTSPDLYEESMSLDLFKDFTDRIANSTPVPDVFKSSVCEDEIWCGGMPYLSIAHYRAGSDGKNLPGDVESVYVDGKQLKSKAFLRDNPLGRRTFDSICADEEKRKSNTEHEPVRVSIGFLDLEHEHITEGKSVVFTRTGLGQICPLCSQGVGGKIYKKGHLVHLAATRKPVNPRTSMSLEEKSMGEIITKKDDAASIVGEDLAQELDEKSLASNILVIRSEDLEARISKVRSAFYDKFIPPTVPQNDPWLYCVLDDSIIIEDGRKLYKVGYSIAEDKVKFDEKKSWSEVVPGFIPKSRVLWEKSDTDIVGTMPTPQPVPFASCYDPNTDSFDQSCIDNSMRGFMVAIRNEMNTVKSETAVDRLYDEVAKSLNKLQGKPVVEESMDKVVEKAKEEAKDEKEVEKEEVKEESTTSKSGDGTGSVIVNPLDAEFEKLKTTVSSGKATREQLQAVFNSLGKAVEDVYVAPAPSATDIAAIVKSAVEEAVRPLAIKVAQIEAGRIDSVSRSLENPISRALTLTPEQLVKKSQPSRKLTQIEAIARKSTGADQ